MAVDTLDGGLQGVYIVHQHLVGDFIFLEDVIVDCRPGESRSKQKAEESEEEHVLELILAKWYLSLIGESRTDPLFDR